MKTAVIYARYSCDNQTEQSIEGQLRVCQDYAKAHDITVIDTYIDRAMTGTNDNRAAFQKMLMDSAKKQWQYILVYKLDRFSRNKIESVIHKKTLRDNGVQILSAMENITDTPEGRMMETILEGFNQYFSEELTQKVNRGLKESWRKGNCTGGRVLFGYDVVDKKYVVNEYESRIVHEAFTKYSQGYRVETIADEFKQKGYRRKNGKLVSTDFLYWTLHNRRYTGVVEHQGEVYTNIFPRIISDELWEKVYAITEENKHAPSRKKEIWGYILSGKLICGDCKHKMAGISGTSQSGATHYYYVCLSRRRKRAECHQPAAPKKWLEDIVINTTVKMLQSSKTIHWIAEGIFALHQKEVTDNTALKLLEKKRSDTEKARNNIVRAIEQGIITESTKNRLTELEAEIDQCDGEIAKEKARSFTFLTVEQIELFLNRYVIDDASNLEIRKLIVNTLIREVILYLDEIVITYNFTDRTEHIKFSKEHVRKTEEQIATATLVGSFSPDCSCILEQRAPNNPGTQ